MVVLQRIAGLEAFINAGHNVMVSYCNSGATRRIKVKITVDAEPSVGQQLRGRCLWLLYIYSRQIYWTTL